LLWYWSERRHLNYANEFLEVADYGLWVACFDPIGGGWGGGICRRSRKEEEFRNMKMKQVGWKRTRIALISTR
jgi:hypothetical protein